MMGNAVVGLVGLLLFALLALLVQARLLVDLDLAVARTLKGFVSDPLDLWATVAGIAGSADLSVLYGAGASLLLWRAGYRRWSAAPLAFLLPTLVEVALKLTIRQMPPPPEFHRWTFYPLTRVDLIGAFPSGHATRSAFFCTFLGVLLWSRGGASLRYLALGFVPLALMLGFSRLYLGQHWTSDIVGGLLLGSSAALLVAPALAREMAKRARR